MSRSRLGLISLCVVVLGLLAFAASSASAAEWLILNSKGEVKTAAEMPVELAGEFDTPNGTLDTHLTGIHIEVQCTKATLLGMKLEGEGKITNGSKAKYESCTVPTPVGKICTVKSPGAAVGTITTKELKGQLQTNGEILIEPKTGTVLAELVFEGAECTLPEGAQAINGVLWLRDCEGKPETHLVKHLIVESTAHGHTLFIGADTAEHLETTVKGGGWIFLAGFGIGLAVGILISH